MQRYAETREASGELLRMILPLLAKQAAGFHPISYALWYEYAAGINPPLKEDMDKLMASGVPLDDSTVAMLYEQHISKRDDAVSTRLRTELERMLQDLSKAANATGEEATAYSKSLGGFGAQLKPGMEPEQLKMAVQAMLEQTEQMCVRTSQLESQLLDSSREVAKLRAELLRAKDEALTDPLTSIANRRGLMKTIESIESNGDGLGNSCLIAVDIDHFKKCNDDYGHLFGDKVIRNVAQILCKMIKGQDTAARIGGEEFMILLPDTPIEGAEKLAEHIRATIAAGRIRTATAGEVGKITISLGVTEYRAGDNIETYLARADKALYASKAGGRDRVTVDSARPLRTKAAADGDPRVVRSRKTPLKAVRS